MTLDDWITRAVTVPFKIRGRDWSGWDCWGLIVCGRATLFNDKVQSFASEYDDKISYAEMTALIDRELPGWNEISEPQFGDVSLYRVGRHASHVSLVLPRGAMIHCEANTGTLCEPLTTRVWARRHVGYFRRATA